MQFSDNTPEPKNEPSNFSFTPQKVSSGLMKPPQMSLALRVRAQVPMIVQKIGLTMLLIGIVTIGGSQFAARVSETPDQTAAVVESTTTSESDASSKPNFSFNFDPVLTGRHAVTISADRGREMNAYIKNQNTGLLVKLIAEEASVNAEAKTFIVNSNELPAGTYYFIGRVHYNSIWYEQHSGPVQVQKPQAVSDSEETGASTTPGTIKYVMNPGSKTIPSVFGSLPTQLSGNQDVVLEVEGIRNLELIIKDSNKKIVDSFEPTEYSDGKYLFTIDTTQFENGSYGFEATFTYNGEDQRTIGPIVKITNLTVETATSTSEEVLPFSVSRTTFDDAARFQTYEFFGPDLTFIEVYVRSDRQTSAQFIGLAERKTGDLWYYSIDTNKLPQGRYNVVASYKRNNELTTYVGPSFTIAPDIVTTPIPPKITEVVESIKPVVTDVKSDTNSAINTSTSIVIGNEQKINEAIDTYTSALRSKDEGAIKRAKDRVMALGVELPFSANGGIVPRDNGAVLAELEEMLVRAERIEKIINERTQDTISVDTDGDGITDYDEVTLYSTDPTNPDTDNDGFTDGAEIVSGFDPKNAKAEVAVVYESPKISGVVRSDIFEVTSVAAVSESEPIPDGVPAQAMISGRGLPNSYVTVYIFSTPVVVTLKTSDDGSFEYKFDKELEDGEHEVYVGFTDNAGTLVAKSNPFAFVKEAQAFTPLNAQANSFVQEPVTQGIDSPLWQAAMLGLIVFVVGFILILLGQQLERTRRDELSSTP